MVRQMLVSAVSEQAALYQRLASEMKEQMEDIAGSKVGSVDPLQLMQRRALQRSKTVRAAMNKFWKALEAHTIAGAYVPKELYINYRYRLKQALLKEEMDPATQIRRWITSEADQNDEDEDKDEGNAILKDEHEGEKLRWQKREKKAARLAAKAARLAAKEEAKQALENKLCGPPSVIDLAAARESERIAKEKGVARTSHELITCSKCNCFVDCLLPSCTYSYNTH